MKGYRYFILTFFAIMFIFTSFYLTVNSFHKDNNSAIASDLGTEEARLNALQPYVRSNDSVFKKEFAHEFDRVVKTIKKIRDIYTKE